MSHSLQCKIKTKHCQSEFMGNKEILPLTRITFINLVSTVLDLWI